MDCVVTVPVETDHYSKLKIVQTSGMLCDSGGKSRDSDIWRFLSCPLVGYNRDYIARAREKEREREMEA